MNEYGFFQKFPPVGSLMISYPITFSSPLKYSATFSHISMNLSFMPFLLVKKSWEKLTTSQERQQWKKDFFMQSYFKGLPQESRRRSTLTGAGKEKELTSQLGNPQPQNFLLQRSWCASNITEMPYVSASLMISLRTERYVQLYSPFFGQNPYQARQSLSELMPQLFNISKSSLTSDPLELYQVLMGQKGDSLQTTLTPCMTLKRLCQSLSTLVTGSTVNYAMPTAIIRISTSIPIPFIMIIYILSQHQRSRINNQSFLRNDMAINSLLLPLVSTINTEFMRKKRKVIPPQNRKTGYGLS